MSASGAFRAFLKSETGPMTVHFWAPMLKWGVVFAGLADFARPADKISPTQNLSLLATGVIWTRWSFVIKPKNYLLASVNTFVALTSGYQLARIVNYRLNEGDDVKQVFNYIINGKDNTAAEVDAEKDQKAQEAIVSN
ncbi:hypothetical protein WICPIJ_000322 [Wickerhamomyces pijperi]|uniref:Mitochondrial pyruvate carrier n=1 Tax=Wickerhamomyces pijperi TaxID=599730 RepID=A0A9P8QGZ2_WICPI|nr:hypothetical protein WICPIJ_000322 [Wickerhamomyces pijperi]